MECDLAGSPRGPLTSGIAHGDLTVEAAGAQQRGVEDVGAVGGGHDDDALVGGKAVHFHQQLVQGLLALVVTAAQARAALTADRVDLVDEDDGRGGSSWPASNRSRTRDAPTPTNISTKSEPEMEKNGTLASPATALASRVLPVPGGPTSSTPLGMRAPRLQEALGVLQELDDLAQLFLFFVRARNLREGDAILVIRHHARPARPKFITLLLPPIC